MADSGGVAIEILDQARTAYGALVDKKGQRVRLLDVAGLTVVADYFLIATATSQQHARALADEVRQEMRKKAGRTPIGVEGEADGWWILLDYGDFLCHIFQAEARNYYDLDATWADAKVVSETDAEAA